MYDCIFDLTLEQEQARFVYWKFIHDDTKNYSENFVDGDSFTFPYTIENGQLTVLDPSFFQGNITEDGIVFVSGNFSDEFSVETSQYKPNEGDLFQYRGQFESVFDVIA